MIISKSLPLPGQKTGKSMLIEMDRDGGTENGQYQECW
jgi:hypothetical protein